MATKTWIATTASTWATAASWSPAVVPLLTDDVIFNSGVGQGNCSVGAAATCKSLVMTGYTGVFSGASTLAITGSDSGTQGNAVGIHGNTLVLSAAGTTANFSYSGTITFTAVNGSGYITCNGKTLNGSITFNDVLGAWDTTDIFTCTLTLTLTLSTWVYVNYDAYIGNISTSGSGIRYIGFFANLYLTGSGALIAATTTTNLSFSCDFMYVWGAQTSSRTLTLNTVVYTSHAYLAGTGSGSITFAPGSSFSPIVYVTNTGGATISFTTGVIAELIFNSGTNVIWNNAVNNTITTNSLTLTSSMASPILTPSFIFIGNLPSTITLAGKSLVTGTVTLNDASIGGGGVVTFADTFSSNAAVIVTSAATVNINSALSCTTFTQTTGVVNANANITTSGLYTLTAGTLNLNSYTHNIFGFSSSNTNIRTLDFGTSTLNITGNAITVWSTSTVTNLTILGTSPTVNFTYSGATGTRVIPMGTLAEASTIIVNITAGTDTIALSGNIKSINFTGFSGIFGIGNTINLYKDFTLSSTQTVTATSAITFAGTSVTQTITSNNVTIPFPIVINSATTTVQTSGALTTTGALTLTTGTLNINANLSIGSASALTLTAGTMTVNNGANISSGTFVSSVANTRTLNMGSGTWTLASTGTIWNMNATSITFDAGQSRILINNTSATATTFAGGGLTYYTIECTRGGGGGQIIFSGNNTYINMINNSSTAAHRFSFLAGTHTFYKFNVRGSAGALVTVDRSGAANAAFIKTGQGVVCNCDYLTVSANTSCSPASGVWYAGANSTGAPAGGWIAGNAPSSQSTLGAGGVG